MRTYRELFGLREFRVLFGIRLIAMLAAVVGNLAIGTVIYDVTRSPLLTALSLFGGPLISLVTSQFLLAVPDLMRPRGLLMLTALAIGVGDLLQLIPGLPLGGRFAILAVSYVVLAATSGTAIGLLADIVPTEAFVLARSTLNITVGGMQILGYAVGAVLLAAVRPVDLFWISGGAGLLAALWVRLGLRDHPPRAAGSVVARTRATNRALLSSPVVRPIFLMMWIPNGLVVGCEAVYIPYAGAHSGFLYAATAVGMLAGDVVIGRFIPNRVGDRLVVPLRVLLALPFTLFFLLPPLPVAAVLGLVAAFGYPAGLPLQERLVRHIPEDTRGQGFGLASTGMMLGQSVGAIISGSLSSLLGGHSSAAGHAMTVMAVLSLTATTLIAPGLRRSARHRSEAARA